MVAVNIEHDNQKGKVMTNKTLQSQIEEFIDRVLGRGVSLVRIAGTFALALKRAADKERVQ